MMRFGGDEDGAGRHEDLAAEKAVLGAVLTDNSILAELQAIVDHQDFAHPAHAQIFEAMVLLEKASERVDHLTLAERLKTLGKLQTVGGPQYLMQLDLVVPSTANAQQYAKIVKDKAIRRRLAQAARDIQKLASSETGTLEEILDESERKIFNLAEKKRVGELVPVKDLLDRTLELIEKMQQNTSGVTGVPTGYVDLDLQLTGLHGGELLILAARPGVGKTSFAMNIATHVALKEQRAAAIFSLEMPAEQLLMRLLASAARVDMKKLRSGGRLSIADQERYQETAASLFNAPLYIDDTGSLSPFDLRSKARRLKQNDPSLGLIIVDYLQLMHSKGAESRQLEIGEISRSLKQLAKELDVPIIALSQLSRKVEERKDGKPMLSDLRESGSIEQDADVVMFIHREARESEGEGGEGDGGGRRPIEVELVVAKQRNGPIGSVDMVFIPEYTRFESRARGGFE
jgi:replicative DNA helicase